MICPKCGSTNINTDRQLCSDPPIPIGFCQDCGAEWCLNATAFCTKKLVVEEDSECLNP